MATQELLIQKTKSSSNLRWWAIAILLSLVILVNQSREVKEFLPVLTVMGIACVYNFFLSLLVYRRLVSRILAWVEILFDVLLIAGIVHFTGGLAHSPFYYLFPVLVLILGMKKNVSEASVFSGAAVVSLLVLSVLEPFDSAMLRPIMDRVIGFGFLSGAVVILLQIVSQVQLHAKHALVESQQQLQELRIKNTNLKNEIFASTRKLEQANVMLVKKNLSMMAFHEIYTAMTSTVNSSKLLNLVIDTAMSLLKANSGALLVLDPVTRSLKLKVGRGLDPKRSKNLEIGWGEGLEGQVARSGKGEWISDLSMAPQVRSISGEARSKMVVPLSIKKKIVGVITIESNQTDAFTLGDFELFSTLGSQASEVLQNVEIYEEMHNKANSLSLLFEVNKHISAIFNLRQLFETILEKAMLVMKARHGSLMIYDRESDQLVMRASIGLSVNPTQARIPVDRGIAGWVYKNVSPILIPSVKLSQLYDGEYDHWYAGKDLIACPLNLRKKIFGVICLNDRIGGKVFNNDDLKLLEALASQAAIAIENVELYASIRRDYLNAIKALAAAVDAKDHYTHGHSNKVMLYATLIARQLGLSEKEVEKVRYSALLHDIGKIGISEELLNKPTELTPKEFDTIAMHPILGVSIVQNIESLKDLIPMILYHHERYGGGGYPEGKSGNSIPLGARIVAVADAWDVMISDRAYRKALPVHVALAELKRGAGTQFDPDIIEVFMKALEQNQSLESFRVEERSILIWDDDEISRLID